MNQIGRQRYHGTNTRNRHQTPAHVIVPDDSQHAAMQGSDLFTKHPPDNEQRLDQHGHHAHLETEVVQGGAQVVLDHRDTKFGASWSFQLSAYAGLAKSDADMAVVRVSAQN